MAEARTDEEQESLRRESREQVVRRQPGGSAGRPDRRKPEQRHSQGPLSSIRAVIKRTSPRPTSLSEAPADRERDRNRRRPQITILSAEPLPSTSWFPGVAAGIPPPPPPAAQIWGPTIPPSIQPPPSYEDVIKEKTQEQELLPSSSLLPPSAFNPLPSITIATQTEAGPEPEQSRVERLGRPPRPPLPDKSPGDSTVPSSQSHPSFQASVETDLPETSLPPSSTFTAQTDLLDLCFVAPPHNGAVERPKPLPRSKAGLQQLRKEVKVQTLVKLRDDSAATLACRAENSSSQQEEGQGRYLQELLQAFSSDDWGFPDHQGDGGDGGDSGDGGEPIQSDSEEEEEEEDMATLKLRIQAFEQQQEAERPEPRPRPRLQGQPGRSAPPVIAPKPKTYSPAPTPSAGVSLDDGCKSADQDQPGNAENSSQELNPKPQTAAKPLASSSTASDPGPCRTTKKPCLAPKPQSATDTAAATGPAPVPAPRPPPPKLPTSTPLNPTPPPRPAAAPRASLGAPHTEKRGNATPGESSPSVQSVKAGSVRSGAPTKPAAPASARRMSTPNLATKPAPVSQTPPDPTTKPTSSPPKPAGQAPPTGPAPALRKAGRINNKAQPTDPPLPPRPAGAKLLPLRPPPIKSIPGRPPPPAVNLHSSSNQNPSKAAPPLSSSANHSQAQKGGKRGPPLPPRPKPGHPLYNSYMKQEVLIVLDDPNPAPSEQVSKDEKEPSSPPLILPLQELLDTPPEDTPTKPAPEPPQSIIPVNPVELKDHPDPPVSGPRCVARFDYEGEADDELTFSRGDVIALQEVIGDEWGRGQIHGRSGIFPLNFTEVVEPLPQVVTSSDESSKDANNSGESLKPAVTETPQDSEAEEWVVAVFDFPGQTTEDLSFQKGALIRVTEHVDAEWLRGRLEGREGLFPGSFAQPYQAQPITDQQCPVGRTAKVLFDFTAEREDELTLKVGDVITQVESVDTDWILGLAGGKRGIVPKNYVSFL